MCRNLTLLISVVLVLGLAGTVRADIEVPPNHTVDTAETHGTFQVNEGGTLEVTSTGILTVSGESTVDGGTLLINDGNVVVNARFNLGQGLGGTVTMNGGSFTITGDDWKMMDSSGGLSVCEVLGGTLTSDNLEFSDPDQRDGMIVIGGGTMIIQDGYDQGNLSRDPQMWKDNGWLVPALGYVEVVITYEPVDGFTLTALGGGGPMALDPIPAYKATDVCPEGVVLSWTPLEAAGDVNGHDVYFGTDYASVLNAQVGDDPNNVYKGRQDSNTYPESGSLSLELGTTYYWRIDEVNEKDPNFWPGFVWEFTTQDGKALDPFPGDGWKGLNPADVNLSWTPACTAVSHNLYFGPNWADVNSGGGGTDKGSQSPGYDPGPLTTFKWYYWRVDEVGDATIKGDVWSFKTGLGGVLMYYTFDGSQGSDLPSPITDDSGNNIQFTKHVAGAGTLKYAGANPVYNSGGTSAEFIPSAGLYKLDEGEDDLLRLDIYQYTIEMWLYINERDYTSEGMILIGHDNDEVSWSFEISDLGDDDDLRWYHNGSDIDEGVLTDRYNEWMHVAAVFDITDPEATQKLYFNGEVVATGNNQGFNPVDANAVTIGCARETDGDFADFLDGRIDELRILDVALAPSDFLYPRATYPSPSDGAGNIDPNDPNEPDDPNVTLSWTPWIGANQHDLYFGTNYINVRDGNDPDLYLGRLDTNSYDVNGLDYATTYYWRIDEVNGSDVYTGIVWQFLTKFLIIDPNLMLWYPYDEGAGEWVYDNSGHGLNGYDDSVSDGWSPDGHFDGCLEFDDNIGFDLEKRTLNGLGSGITISVWLDGYREDEENWVINAGSGDNYIDVIVPDGEDDYVYWRAGNDSNDLLIWNDATPDAWVGDWHHFAFVKDEDAGTMSIYFDSGLARFKSGTVETLADIANTPFSVAAKLGSDSDYVGRMDDLRVYNYALSEKEIAALFRGGDVELAWGPSPYDGQADAPYDSDLIWNIGDYADLHDVYFGTDWDDVNDASAGSHLNVDYDRVDVNSYELDLLQLGKTYYWRIDEVNEANDDTWKGKVWRFRVADYIVIDNMEDYTVIGGDYPIVGFAEPRGWDCGYQNDTGSSLDLVPTTLWDVLAHRSDQAMYYWYDNTYDPGAGCYSEISNHFTLDPNNWTTAGVKMLTLWFYGYTGNATTGIEQMYAGLEDSDSDYAEVRYGNNEGEDINDINLAEWQDWNISLSWFTDANDELNLTNIKKLYIGFGERGASEAGGSGQVCFDNIRLYQPICFPSKRSPEFAKLDMDNDCIIGFGDVEIMAQEWLDSDIDLGEVTNPTDANLVGWWNFDEDEDDGDGNVVTDSSGNGHHGTIETNDVDVYWIAGRNDVNYALDFDGGRVLVPDAPQLRPLHQVSALAWIKYSVDQSSGRIVVKGPDNKETYGLEVSGEDELVFLVRDGNDPNAKECPKYDAKSDKGALERDEWVHCAGTYDGDVLKCYINGVFVAENNDANAITYLGHPLSQDPNDLAIGNRSDSTNRPFKGIIDDVRVYNRALTAAEVGYLASDSTGVVDIQSIANLIDGEAPGKKAVNLRDFAMLADNWLQEEMWPE